MSKISYFEVKQANEAADESRRALKQAIKACRVFMKGKGALDNTIRKRVVDYRLKSRKARSLSQAYVRQCLSLRA